MTDNKENKKIVDPETGKEEETSQFDGDKSLEKEVKSSNESLNFNDIDDKYSTDTEYRNNTIDEAGQVSAPSAEGRRTRVDELSENPSEESKND